MTALPSSLPPVASVLLAASFAFALASVPPASAQEPSLPDAILGKAPPPQGETVRYVPGDSSTKGYLAVPKGAGPFPALILIHEWNGLNDRVREVADAFAQRGYVALAVDLYEGRTGSDREENVRLMNEVHEHLGRAIANLDDAQKFLRARSDVSGKIGVMGWCFGGGMALQYAIQGAPHDATAIFYGPLVTDPAELRRIHHPIYGTFAGQDRGIPPTQVRKFKAVLDSLGIRNDIRDYEPVNHAFWLWVDQDPAKREAPATDAWRRLLAFLSETLR